MNDDITFQVHVFWSLQSAWLSLRNARGLATNPLHRSNVFDRLGLRMLHLQVGFSLWMRARLLSRHELREVVCLELVDAAEAGRTARDIAQDTLLPLHQVYQHCGALVHDRLVVRDEATGRYRWSPLGAAVAGLGVAVLGEPPP